MPKYSAADIPAEAVRGTLDHELGEWLKTAPTLGGHEPIHEQRVAHDWLIAKVPPPIGRVERLGLPGPHGTVPVRCYHPSRPGLADGAALVYMHGGGWTVGTLDQFDAPMRIFAERSGAQVYAVDYKLAPEYQWPVQLEENEFVVRGLVETAPAGASTPRALRWAATPPAAT